MTKMVGHKEKQMVAGENGLKNGLIENSPIQWSCGQCGGVEEGGEGLQSHPTSPAPIAQAEKKRFFFSRSSSLNTQRSPDFGHKNGIITATGAYAPQVFAGFVQA